MRKPTISTESGRYFLTDRIREEVNFYLTSQNSGDPAPRVQKTASPDATLIQLPKSICLHMRENAKPLQYKD